ncbi:MAG TPA: diadenylate cyclase, partial [Pirellulales bacterium]|nr:diadenylate cyclase [Pirellulales bacterium]
AKEASAQKHGALLVISEGAAQEADRLANDCTRIRPASLDVETFARVTRIDGAVLLDPQGNCHAIGVILDGLASAKGDPARGSRYNSAVRYVENRKSEYPTLAVVVSEDGTIDFV